MIFPTIKKELQLIRIGHKYIAGVDEVGRGPLAGPVVASAVVFDWDDEKNQKLGTRNLGLDVKKNLVRDSKTLSENQRVKLYSWIIQNCLCWASGIVSHQDIDKIGIRQASLAAMAEAIAGLSRKPDAILIDGRDIIEYLDIYQDPVIKGDRDIFSISSASIIAKVTRDEIMKKYDLVFPQYGFAEHKGYGTCAHYERLEMFGECRIHRKSFRLSQKSVKPEVL